MGGNPSFRYGDHSAWHDGKGKDAVCLPAHSFFSRVAAFLAEDSGKFLFLFLLCSFLLSARVHAGQSIAVDAVALDGGTVAPAQADVVVWKAVVTAGDEGGSVTALTLTLTGDTAADIAGMQLHEEDDATSGRRLLASGVLSGKTAAFTGFNVVLDSSTSRSLVVTAVIAAETTEGNAISGEIASAGDITAAGHVAGHFPLRSLDPAHPYRVAVTATALRVSAWPASVKAGQTVSFTVSCVDANGNVDRDHAGSYLSLAGTPGNAPGAAETGQAPEYAGAGTWSSDEGGSRECSFTLYRVESGKSVRVSDDQLGVVDSDPLTVTGEALSGKIAIAPLGDQTAGIPFSVTLYTLDGYGNRTSGHTGSVTTLSSETGLIASPGGYGPVLPPYSWRGDEPQGQAVLTVITYNRCSGARLRVDDSVLGGALSNEFTVAGAPATAYALSGPAAVRIKTKVSLGAAAKDQWGNVLSDYRGFARLSCSDDGAQFQSPVAFSGGSATMDIIFTTWGACSVTLQELSNHAIKGTMDVSVDMPPLPSRFAVSAPASVAGSAAFTASVAALDGGGEVIPEYRHAVALSVQPPAVISPDQVFLEAGRWQGELRISGETLETGITVSDGDVTTADALVVAVRTNDPYKARAYPTVFNPHRGSLRIRYFLREDRGVHVKIYNAAMDLVREIDAPAGSAGGRAGINVVEWDGRSGGNNSISHSGGYHILIDKGYEEEWSGAVIKNY